MEKLTAIQDFPSSIELPARTLLISNIMPDLSLQKSTDFLEDLKILVGYRKMGTPTQQDYM